MKEKLINLYRELNILDLPLHQKCPNCSICWPDPDDLELKPHGSDELFIYTPWVGPRYGSFKLLVLGINMNQDSGPGKLSKQEEYVSTAKREVSKGRIKILKSGNYPGTIYWHRLPTYISILLEKNNKIQLRWVDEFPSKENISSAFDYAAITNIIKCSPNQDNGRGTPTPTMWDKCTEFILKEEINILNPDTILILGLSNYNQIKCHVFDVPPIELDEDDCFKRGKGYLSNKLVEFYVVVHPTAPGNNSGSRRELMLKFCEFLYKDSIDKIKAGLLKISEKYNLNMDYFNLPLGRGDSGFYFYPNYSESGLAVGFGFNESWGQELFYGIYNRKTTNNSDIVNKLEVIAKNNGINSHDNYPIWYWFNGYEIKFENVFCNIDVDEFLRQVEMRLGQMLLLIERI
jgi:hypothetical protein